MKIAAIVTLIGLVACLAAGGMGLPVVAGVAKMLASCGFMAMALAGGAMQSRYGVAVLVALFFSWWGDLFLIFPDSMFLAGLIAFFIGHVGYAVAFLVHGVRWPWVGGGVAALVIPTLVIFPWLNPHLGDDLRIPVYAYIGVISTMVALSFGSWKKEGTWLMVLAAVMFYVSDIFVARDKFVSSGYENRLLGLPLYYGGQMVFAYGILVRNRIAGMGRPGS